MRAHRLLATLIASAVLASLAVFPTAAGAASGKGSYIVVLKQGASSASVAARHGKKYGAQVKHIYRHTIKGYSATLKRADVAALRADPNVAFVERNGRVTIAAKDGTRGPRASKRKGAAYSFPSWGIDRIDQRNLPLSSSYLTRSQGGGVTAYVIDTGIRVSHQEFGGRASHGWDFVDDDAVASDCNGHGTHVAGTIGGATYGVAREVRLVGVRVLDCSGSGTWAGVIAGIDWAVGRSGGPKVLNLSLGGGANSAVDSAIARAVQAGAVVAVAAGNSSANACNYSPARAPSALTVGATTNTDARASYSNVGSCLDVFGPGSSIKSAWSTGDSATKTISGTSMASPHVAGVAALFLASSPSASPGAVASAITSNATPNVVGNPGSGSPNRLLYTDY